MALERYMFINGDESEVVIEITAYENVGVFAMRAQGADIEELVATHAVPEKQEQVVFTMTIPAGAIHGFATYQRPDFTNPKPDQLKVVTTSNKDPWPDPPGSVQSAYATRYPSFLLAFGGSRGAPEQTTLE